MSEFIIDFKKSDFEQPSYSADAYVLRRANLVETGAELRAYQQSTQKAGEQAAQDLKSHVFQNYNLFIETSREIAKLDNDLQDIRALLSDTNSILRHVNELCETEREEEGPGASAQQQMKLMDIAARIDGCPADFLKYPNRHLLMEEDLKELEEMGAAGGYQEVRTVRFFVFTDIVLVGIQALSGSAVTGTDGGGPKARRPAMTVQDGADQRYRLMYIWDLERLLLIDINKNNRDPDEVQNAFRLMEPHAGVYQCGDHQSKQDFLYTIHTQQQHIKDLAAVKGDEAHRQRKEKTAVVVEPTSDDENSDTAATAQHSMSEADQAVLEENDWVFEASDDLDVYIAQREFEKAVKLIHKTQAFVRAKRVSNEMLMAELDDMIEVRQEEITGLLMSELSNPTMKKKDMQRCIKLCVSLGQNNRARAMFLKNRGDGLHRDMRHIKIEGVTEVYVYKLSQMFFNFIRTVTMEFLSSFSAVADRSALVVWAASQVAHYVTIFKRQVFMGGSFSTAVKCLIITQENSAPVEECGMELFFIVAEMVKEELQRKATEKMELLNKQADQRLSASSTERVAYQHHLDMTKVQLHPSTKLFCEQTEQFSQDVCALDGMEIDRFLVECVCSLLECQVTRLTSTVNAKDKTKAQDLDQDLQFVVNKYYDSIRTTVVNKYPAARNIFRLQKVSLLRVVEEKREQRIAMAQAPKLPPKGVVPKVPPKENGNSPRSPRSPRSPKSPSLTVPKSPTTLAIPQ